MNYTKEEKEFFSNKARELIAQLRRENIPINHQAQIFRAAISEIRLANTSGTGPTSDYIHQGPGYSVINARICNRFPTIGELLSAYREEILAIRGVGPKTLQRLYDELVKSGYYPSWQP